MKVMKGDRHNKIAMRILKGIRNTRKQMIIKWIPAHVGLEGNERADILAKDGARNGTPIYYSLQLKDAYRILEETQREEWKNWYVLKMEKGRAYFEVAPNHGTRTQNYQVSTPTVNRILTTHTYTPNWLAKMGVAIERVCDLCEEEMGI
jgi:hypothetical protein